MYFRTIAAALICFFAASAGAQPATQPAEKTAIAPDVQAILDQVGKAYTAPGGLSLVGKLSLDFEAGEEKKHDSADFTASFLAPNKFRHEIKDELLVVSTGEKLFAYLPTKKEYISLDVPKERIDLTGVSQPIEQLLGAQDPVLLMALSKDPIKRLTEGGTNFAKADDVKIADASYNALTFQKGDQNYRVLVDPATHFIRQIRVDKKQEVIKRGLDTVKIADITFDYSSTKAEGAAADAYAWAPPKDATLAKEDAPEGSGEAAVALEGKPAPDFKLTGIDGKAVALADLKGSVVVLDFWATWCGPCVASLPHIDKMASEMADKGVKMFAINLEEPKAQVQKFVVTQKLTLPVLLDTDGAVGKQYMASAIPETVVIGKDGMVKKVFVGFGGDEALRAAVEAEMKK